ncbi:MAG: hypothetical protein H6739_31990 [Alphaproteobacteria bacterium]|nr:hypothetical protein [Alphaproteobacteria bacterium]
MTWLDDDEIHERLQSGEALALSEALAAMELRLEAIDLPKPPTLTAAQLAPLARQADYATAQRMADLLLETQGDRGPGVLATLVATALPLEAMHAVAMSLKVHAEPGSTVRGVVERLGPALELVEASRVAPVQHFLSCLLDGRPPVVEGTREALGTWRDGEVTREIVKGL